MIECNIPGVSLYFCDILIGSEDTGRGRISLLKSI